MVRLVESINEWVCIGLIVMLLAIRFFIRFVANLDKQLMVSTQYLVCLIALEDITGSFETHKVWLYLKDIIVQDFPSIDTRYHPDALVTELAGHLHAREPHVLDTPVLHTVDHLMMKIKAESLLFGLNGNSQVIAPRDIILGIDAALAYLKTP